MVKKGHEALFSYALGNAFSIMFNHIRPMPNSKCDQSHPNHAFIPRAKSSRCCGFSDTQRLIQIWSR